METAEEGFTYSFGGGDDPTGYDSWPGVPQRDREALKPLYDGDDFEGVQQCGG